MNQTIYNYKAINDTHRNNDDSEVNDINKHNNK